MVIRGGTSNTDPSRTSNGSAAWAAAPVRLDRGKRRTALSNPNSELGRSTRALPSPGTFPRTNVSPKMLPRPPLLIEMPARHRRGQSQKTFLGFRCESLGGRYRFFLSNRRKNKHKAQTSRFVIGQEIHVLASRAHLHLPKLATAVVLGEYIDGLEVVFTMKSD